MAVKGYTKSYTNPHKPYIAQISIQGRTHYLGSHKTEEQAHAAYLAARKVNRPFKKYGVKS